MTRRATAESRRSALCRCLASERRRYTAVRLRDAPAETTTRDDLAAAGATPEAGPTPADRRPVAAGLADAGGLA
jgi:hypothetical protein